MKYVRIFEENILETKSRAHISLLNIFVCNVKPEHHTILRNTHEFQNTRIYISTKSLKHSFDRRSDFMENNIEFIFRTLKNPSYICVNVFGKNGKKIRKRGDFIYFGHRYGDKYYAIPVEVTEDANGNTGLEVVSFFPSTKKYKEKFPTIWECDNPNGLPTLWDREDGGNPPS